MKLYGGVDLHSNDSMVVLLNEDDKGSLQHIANPRFAGTGRWRVGRFEN
jgi:hypothetical protein